MKNGLLSLGSFIFGLIGIILFAMFVPDFRRFEIIFILIVAIVTTYFLVKQSNIDSAKEEKLKKQRIQKLEAKYANYVKIVEEAIQNMIIKVEKDVPVTILKEPFGHHYLISFEEYLNWICKNRITGKPDTFIIASCLMYSLMHKRMIVTSDIKNYNDEIEKLLLTINCQLAFNIALEIISEPITFDKDETNGKYIIPKHHPKKNIVVPEGLIQDSPLYNRILRNIVKDYIANSDSRPIMQFANLLQLIYLNCK